MIIEIKYFIWGEDTELPQHNSPTIVAKQL